MKEIADHWNSHSAEQKRMWQQPAAPPPVPVPVPVRPAAQANSGHSVWPKCGDDFYPIRSAVLHDLPAQVAALSHEWRTHVSDEVLSASRSLDAGDVKHLCEAEYGAGRCASTLADADKTALAKARVTIRQWCNLRRPKPCKVDGVWESPSLLYVGPREAPPASADALPPGYLVLQLYAELSPLVLVACVQRSMPPTPGDVVQLRLSFETLLSDAELARTKHVCSDCVASTTSVPLALMRKATEHTLKFQAGDMVSVHIKPKHGAKGHEPKWSSTRHIVIRIDGNKYLTDYFSKKKLFLRHELLKV